MRGPATFGLEPAELSVTADFFDDLGGHSLLAATCVSLLRERGVGVSPAVRDLYSNPTVRTLGRAGSDARPRTCSSAGASRRRGPCRERHSQRALQPRRRQCRPPSCTCMLLVLTLPVAAIYAVNDGEISIGGADA